MKVKSKIFSILLFYCLTNVAMENNIFNKFCKNTVICCGICFLCAFFLNATHSAIETPRIEQLQCIKEPFEKHACFERFNHDFNNYPKHPLNENDCAKINEVLNNCKRTSRFSTLKIVKKLNVTYKNKCKQE